MKEFVEKLIGRLEEYERKSYNTYCEHGLRTDSGRSFGSKEIIRIVNQLAEEMGVSKIENTTWIPCTVVEHPEHCNDCEVTIKDVRGYSRDIAYYTDKWRRLADEKPVLVVAWKEPSKPYQKGE